MPRRQWSLQRVSLWTVALLLLHASAMADVAQDIANLEPGHWYEIPSSALDTAGVIPDPAPPGNPRNVMAAWSGGVYDTKRDRLLIWGGGHADYSGNEIYAFDMSATFRWSRLWGPTPVADIPTSGCHQAYPDGSPSSRHTYNHLAYMPEPYDALFNHGGSYWRNGQPPPYVATWHFDIQSLTWQDKGEIEGNPGGGSAAYDPVTGRVFARSKGGMFEYAPALASWTKRYHDGAGLWSFPTGDIDPINRKMLLLGGGTLHEFDVETYAYGTHTAADLIGDTEILGATSPGFVYDSASQAFVAWSGDPANDLRPEDVYVIDPVTLEISKRTPAATNTVSPTNAARWGTYGRWRYVPSKNVFVLVNSIYESVFVYRLSPESTGPVCGDGTCDASEGGGNQDDASVTGDQNSDSTPHSSDGSIGADGDLNGTSADQLTGCSCEQRAAPVDVCGMLLLLGGYALHRVRFRARRRSN